MSFGGTVSAMITSLKNNARPKRKRLFDRSIPETDIKLRPRKKATKEQLEQARLKMKDENRKLLYRRIAALLVSLIIFFLLLYTVYWLKTK
ncbi:MAG: hypothetical protein C0595_07990 [Marinilabiliales bacterium]|nr:MAG: hypothetical protein C0595_07990 [Marinilabiliales bacterium]